MTAFRQILSLVYILLLTLATEAQSSAPIDFDPDHQAAVTLIVPEFRAEVIAHSPNRLSGQTRDIRIATKHREYSVGLPFQFYQVNSILRGPSNRLVVIGMAAGEVYEVGILDLRASRVIDRFTCYQPSVSADGRFVAFTKFFGPHSAPSPDDHNMLYSVAQSPSENRPEGISSDNDVDVGFAVYPIGVGNRKADNMNVPSEAAHIVAGSYIWSGVSQYFFADRTSTDFSIVGVSVGNNAASVSRLTLSSQVLGTQTFYPYLPRLVNVAINDHALALQISTNATRWLSVDIGNFEQLGSVNLRPTGSKP